MVATPFYPHAIAFSNPAEVITQLTNVSPMYNFQDVVEFSSGDVAPFWSGSLSAAPVFNFSSRQVKALLDLCSPAVHAAEGKSYVAHDATAGTVELIYRKGESYGFRTADITAEHEQLTMTNGFLRWDTLTANQGQLADLSCLLAAGWNGTDDPLVQTAVALSESQAVDHLYTLGPIALADVHIGGLQGYTFSTNVTPEIIFDEGEHFPRYLGAATYNPVITARFRNASLMRTLNTTPGNPRGQAFTDLSFYLRKLKAADLCETDATAAHIKFSATAGMIKARQLDNRGLCEVFFQIQRPDSSSYAFTYNTATTIVTA